MKLNISNFDLRYDFDFNIKSYFKYLDGKYIEIQATVLCTGSVTDLTHNTKLST